MEGAHEVVGRRLGGGIRRVRRVGRLFGEELRAVGRPAVGAVELQRAVHFVGGDVVEEFPLISFRQAFPVIPGLLEQRQRAQHVGAREGEGVAYGAVHVALGGKVYDAVYLMLAQGVCHCLCVADVGVHEAVVRCLLHVAQVLEVAGVGEFVEVYDVVAGVSVHEAPHHVRAYEAGAPGDKDRAFSHCA